MVVLRYRQGIHESAILQHFGEKACQSDAYAGDVPAGPSVFLCFTNRSGSNFVANCLASTGHFREAREALNGPVVVNNSVKRGFTSFPEYCAVIKRQAEGQRGEFAVKASWNQLFFLHRLGILDAIFADRHYVFIRRRDLVAQAVSHAIAIQTRKFKSSHTGTGAEPEYDFRKIAGILRSISASNRFFLEFFAVTGAPYFEIVYEDFIEGPAAHLDSLCQRLSLPRYALDAEKITLRVQRNEINKAFQRRFLEDMKSAKVNIGSAEIDGLLC